MLKKSVFLVAALFLIGVTVVSAQTRQQEQELEQIARRSMNGLSQPDRQRVIQIMTDVFVAQGIPRQQAITLAEANADTMFSDSDNQMTPEQQRMFAEQEEQIKAFEQRQQEAQRQAQQPRQPQQPQQPGEKAGWPPAAAFQSYFKLPALRQPAGTSVRYDGAPNNDGHWTWVRVYLSGGNAAAVLQDLVRQIETATGEKFGGQENNIRSLGFSTSRYYTFYVQLEQENGMVVLTIGESVA
jgi:hypothetical protein